MIFDRMGSSDEDPAFSIVPWRLDGEVFQVSGNFIEIVFLYCKFATVPLLLRNYHIACIFEQIANFTTFNMPICPPLLYPLLIALAIAIIIFLPWLVSTSSTFIQELWDIGMPPSLCNGLLQCELVEIPLPH